MDPPALFWIDYFESLSKMYSLPLNFGSIILDSHLFWIDYFGFPFQMDRRVFWIDYFGFPYHGSIIMARVFWIDYFGSVIDYGMYYGAVGVNLKRDIHSHAARLHAHDIRLV